jgi:hypothetical protein
VQEITIYEVVVAANGMNFVPNFAKNLPIVQNMKGGEYSHTKSVVNS